MKSPPRPLGWYQYSRRTLLVLVTVCTIGLGWLGWEVKQAVERRQEAINLQKTDEHWRHHDHPVHLSGLTQLKTLDLRYTKMTNTGVTKLKQLTSALKITWSANPFLK